MLGTELKNKPDVDLFIRVNRMDKIFLSQLLPDRGIFVMLCSACLTQAAEDLKLLGINCYDDNSRLKIIEYAQSKFPKAFRDTIASTDTETGGSNG